MNEASKYIKPRSIVVIGASTGGPKVLTRIIENLEDYDYPAILIAQHMLYELIPDFVDLLKQKSGINIKLGSNNMPIEKSTIYVAPGNSDMILMEYDNKYVLRLIESKSDLNPSIDILMNSVAEIYRDKTLGIILTGMGNDGLLGITKIKSLGGRTIVQNNKTAEISSMPNNIVDNELADQILEIDDISKAIRIWGMANE